MATTTAPPAALILVGGFGTRLRPLTFTKAKPLVEFCLKPILMHQLEALAKVGVKTIVLAISYKPEHMLAFIDEVKTKLDVEIVCSHETEPLGTAGPLALAREHLEGSECFFVFNSDVTCEYPLERLLEFHRGHGAEGSMVVTGVAEPSKYGVVVYKEDGRISHFVEKPQTFVSSTINAGLYILNSTVLDRIELKPTSIEKEIFPQMTKEGQLYAIECLDYWMDIGQPKDYLTGMVLHLEHMQKEGAALATGEGIVGNVLIHPTATIGKDCVLGPDVVVGAGCVLENGVRVRRSTLLANTRVQSHACISDTIVGWESVIGQWAHLAGGGTVSVLGENVTIKDEISINGAIILPHKSIKDSISKSGTIVM